MTATDKLPLDGKVRVAGHDTPFIYRGYLVSDFNKCAVTPEAGGSTVWVGRSTLSVWKEAK